MGYKKAAHRSTGAENVALTRQTGLGKLQDELRAAWRFQAPAPPSEVRNFDPQGASGFSRYIGRPVLSRTLSYVVKQWKQLAAERQLSFYPRPIDLRYLGQQTLETIKYCSKHGVTEDGEVIPNVLFNPVRAAGQILETAFDDPLNLDTQVAASNFDGFGTRLTVRTFPKKTGWGVHLVTGVDLSETDSLEWNPASALANEMNYFHSHFDPYYDHEETGSAQPARMGIYVPLGVVEGVESAADERFQDMAAVCQNLLPIRVLLGHVQLVEGNIT